MAKTTPAETLTMNPVESIDPTSAPANIIIGTIDNGQAEFTGTATTDLANDQLALSITGFAPPTSETYIPFYGNGPGVPWGVGLSLPGQGFSQGVYHATMTVAYTQSGIIPPTQASENFILATQNSPFEVVGILFIDASEKLGTNTQTENTILSGVQAGLQVLETDGYAPKPMSDLIKDVTKELKLLDFDGTSAIIPAATATKLEDMQVSMSTYVHDTPALVALMPHGGWSVYV